MSNAEAGKGNSDTKSKHLIKSNMEVYLISEGYDFNTSTGAKSDRSKSSVEKRDYDNNNRYDAEMHVYEVVGYNFDPQGKGSNPFPDEKKDGSEIRYIYFAKE
jgi:hypothetical protein